MNLAIDLFLRGNHSDGDYDVLLGSAPARLWHPRLRWCRFTCTRSGGNFPCRQYRGIALRPVPPVGAGVAHGRLSSLKKRISPERKRNICSGRAHKVPAIILSDTGINPLRDNRLRNREIRRDTGANMRGESYRSKRDLINIC